MYFVISYLTQTSPYIYNLYGLLRFTTVDVYK